MSIFILFSIYLCSIEFNCQETWYTGQYQGYR